MTLLGRSVSEARRVIEMEEVLEARMVVGVSRGVSSRKMLFLTSSFSVAASMARSVWPMSLRPSAARMRARPLSMAAWSMWPRLTWRAMFFLMVSRHAVTRSGDTS